MPFELKKEIKEKVRAAVKDLGGIDQITVEKIFGNGDLLEAFRSFCKGEHSEENILFLQAVRAFKQTGAKGKTAYQIKTNYMGADAKRQINLTGQSFQAWKKRYDEVVDVANEEGMSVESTIFDSLYDEIATMLDGDTVRRFKIELQKAL
jgi:hypothetical protein